MFCFAIRIFLFPFVVILKRLMINMEKKAFVRLMLLVFLGFSYLLLSGAAVPTTRSLKSNKQLPSSLQDLLAQDVMKLSDAEELLGEAEALNGERLLLESTDYPGTGANKNHDPKTPGTARAHEP